MQQLSLKVNKILKQKESSLSFYKDSQSYLELNEIAGKRKNYISS